MVRRSLDGQMMRSVLSTTLALPSEQYNNTHLKISRSRVHRCYPHHQRASTAVVHGCTRRCIWYYVEFLAWIGQIKGLETRWRKKGVGRHLRQRCV